MSSPSATEVHAVIASEAEARVVIEGEITAEQMQSRVERMKLALDGEPNRDLEKLGANIEKRLRAMGRDLRQQVAAGDLTEEEARAKYEAAAVDDASAMLQYVSCLLGNSSAAQL